MVQHLKRVMLREEFTDLTGDPINAILLNYFVNEGLSKPFSNVVSSAEEISQTTLLRLPKSTLRDHLRSLIVQDWLEVERKPGHANGYKVNFRKILHDLNKLGYEFTRENLDCADWIEEVEPL